MAFVGCVNRVMAIDLSSDASGLYLNDSSDITRFSPRGNRLALMDANARNVKVIDFKERHTVCSIDLLEKMIVSQPRLEFSNDGQLIAFQTCKPSVAVHKVESGLRLADFSSKNGIRCRCLRFNPSNTMLAAVVGFDELFVWNLETNKVQFSSRFDKLWASDFSKDGKSLIVLTEGALMRQPIKGGAPEMLVSVYNTSQASGKTQLNSMGNFVLAQDGRMASLDCWITKSQSSTGVVYRRPKQINGGISYGTRKK